MKLTIKNPAPYDDSQKRWGDFHFGRALQCSLESKGARVFQDFQPKWSMDHKEDVVLVLRGLSKFQPSKAKFNILWIISHPAMITSEELDAYDLILTVSAFHCTLLRKITKTRVEIARHCTDFEKFFPAGLSLSEEAELRKGIVYVANSRGQRREMAQWVEETNTNVRVFGRAWDKFGIGQLVEKEYLPNSDLPELYRSARLCLNDHWKDMRAFGFINNRVFDSLACGLPILSDSFPEIRAVFGDTLLYARNAEEFRDKIAFCKSNYDEVLGRVRETWKELGALYTFDARADELIHWIENPLSHRPHCQSSNAKIGQEDVFYSVLREFVIQEEEKTAHLEALISNQTQLANKANREMVWAKEKREEEKRAKEEFRSNMERAERKIECMAEKKSTQEQAQYQLQNELKAVNGQLSDLEIRLQKEKNIRISLFNYSKILRNELKAIYKSRSWKIGAPYRIIARAIVGLLRGKKMGKARIPDWPLPIAELKNPHDAYPDPYPLKPAKSQPDVAQQVPTGSFQNPIFADQIYVSSAESSAAPMVRLRQMPVYSRFRRFPGSIRYQSQQILLPIKRRLSRQNIQAFRSVLSRVGVKKSANATRQKPGKSSNDLETGLPDFAGNGVRQQPVSVETAPEIEKSSGYWHDNAMQLLRELETMQRDADGNPSFLSKNTLQNNILYKRDISSTEAESGINCEGNPYPYQEKSWEYWQGQARQLHEEIEYVKAGLRKGQRLPVFI